MLRVTILCIHLANRSSNMNRWNIIVVVVVEKRLQYFDVVFLCCVALACVLYFSLFFAAVHILPFKLRVPQRAGDMLFFKRASESIHGCIDADDVFQWQTEQNGTKDRFAKLFRTFERLVFFSAVVVPNAVANYVAMAASYRNIQNTNATHIQMCWRLNGINKNFRQTCEHALKWICSIFDGFIKLNSEQWAYNREWSLWCSQKR